MGNQGYRANYLAAFEGANHQLEHIYSEYHELQRRKEKLEGVLSALEPFLQSASTYRQDLLAPEPVIHDPQPAYSEPVYAEQYSVPEPVVEPVVYEERFAEPVAQTTYAAAGEADLDPLQLRINRALGLAVA
jgi:hypothetical protein